MTGNRIDIMALTSEDLAEELTLRYGKGRHHAAGLYREFYRRRGSGIGDARSIAEFTGSGELADRIGGDLALDVPPVVGRVAEGNLVKFVTRLTDGLEIESVVVPMGHHQALCVSCQVGCPWGCVFCQTAQLGFIRNLTVAEMVSQVYRVKTIWGVDIKTVVFMGMGEPLENLDNVIQAIRVISDQRGLDIAKRHITISTAGIPAGLEKLASLNWRDLNIAVSVNAPNDQIRSRLMPVNRAYPMAKLKQSLASYPLKRKGRFFIEYVLIQGVNDSPEHARELADYLKPLRVKVNVIPYNPGPDTSLSPPADDDVARFCGCLAAEKLFVRKREGKGAGVMAACGQLGSGMPVNLRRANGVGAASQVRSGGIPEGTGTRGKG